LNTINHVPIIVKLPLIDNPPFHPNPGLV
jgi:hypothetical protein